MPENQHNMRTLEQLVLRANIETYEFRGKKIFLYMDHRTILNIIFYALKFKLIPEVPNVLYFDYHSDACTPSHLIQDRTSGFNIDETSLEDFNSIVEFEMGPLDDDWVKSGMELGLIKHSVSIGTEKYDHSYETYKDTKDTEHDVICISHLNYELSGRGALGDSIIVQPYYSKVRSIFNYNNGSDGFGETTEPFILDFDLDCFSAEFRGRTMAWPESMFRDEFGTPTGFHKNILPADILDALIDRCEFITICMEPGCCGGLGESFKILSYLDKYIFDGALKTRPVQ